MHESHVIGSLAFAADGTLLVSTGHGASYYLMDAGSDSDTYRLLVSHYCLNSSLISSGYHTGRLQYFDLQKPIL